MVIQTGSLLWMGIAGESLLAEEKQFIEKEKISGVVLFKRNIKSFQQLFELCEELHHLRPPPLIALDREGGPVDRLRHLEKAPLWPAPRKLAGASLGEIQHSAFLMGREMRALGIDINLAPALDVEWVFSDLFKDRLWGSSPLEVIRKSRAFLTGLHRAGLLSCVKHFPGHGGVREDSHITLPVDKRPLSRLQQMDIAVFRPLLKKAPLLMTAHVLYPAWDVWNPATLSACILQELRQKLQFSGVIVSDDLDMKALRQLPPPRWACNWPSHVRLPLSALKAGVDILLKCQSSQEMREWPALIRHALKQGSLSLKQVIPQIERVQQLQKSSKAPAPLSWPHALLCIQQSRTWCAFLQKKYKDSFF